MSKAIQSLLLALLTMAASNLLAAESCPAGATGVTVPQFSIYIRNSTTEVTGSTIGACEELELQAGLIYNAQCPGGLTCVSFSDGILEITEVTNHVPTQLYSTNVFGVPGKPSVPLIGPLTDPVNCPGAIAGIESERVLYTLTPANIEAGRVTFRVSYYNCTLWLSGFQSNSASGSYESFVRIAPQPNCSVIPASDSVPARSSPSFRINPSGPGPFIYKWSGPNDFSSTDETIFITNAQPENAGVYIATVTDRFGCSTSSSAALFVQPPSPRMTTVRLKGSDLILTGSDGSPNAPYSIVTTTDANTPMTSWVPVATNYFDGNGEFIFTNQINLNDGKRYFRLMVQ